MPTPNLGPSNPFVEFRMDEIEQSISQRFLQQVRAHGNRPAIKTGGKALTYAELNNRANRFANAILSRRRPGQEPVAFLLEERSRQVAAILGILKAGKIYVALDPSFPPGRNQAILKDCRPGLLLTDAANLELAKKVTQGQVPLLDLSDNPGQYPTHEPDQPQSAASLAYILYTSSSTGKPKGVVQSHRNLLHNILKTTNGLHICPEDRCTQIPSCGFGASVTDIFGTLLNGASLFPFDMKKESLASLVELLVQEKITIYHSVPSLFRHLARALTGQESMPHLRLIKLGGEPVLLKDVELCREHFPPGCLFHVNLGATEMHVIRQYFLDHDAPLPGSRVPVGYPVADTEVLILDEQGKELGPDQEGEIAIRSRYLPVEIWGNPELTQSLFIVDRRSASDSAAERRSTESAAERRSTDSDKRVYRLGDLGLIRADGCLEHRGRKDFQVKIRGNRVETAEVEMALLGIDSIRDAVVLAKEWQPGDPVLVAYLVSAVAPPPPISDLHFRLHKQLPEYMIPSAYVFLKELPLTPTGKVALGELKPPSYGRPNLATKFIEPQNPTEQIVTLVWEDILHIRPIGNRDNFFELGGNSLLAVSMMSRLEKTTGKKIRLGILYEKPTIEHLALFLSNPGDQADTWHIPLQTGTSGITFFFLHGDFAGGGFYVRELARHFGNQHSFISIHPHGLLGDSMPQTIEAMAADCLDKIRTLQPVGPYYLGGHCNGGIIAFEMAHMLHREGEKVALVVNYDPPPTKDYLRRHGKPRPEEKDLDALAGNLDLTGLTLEARHHTLKRVYHRAIVHYFEARYPGKLTLMRPREFAVPHRERTFGWKDMASTVELIELPGDHFTSMARYVGDVAQELLRCIARARGA